MANTLYDKGREAFLSGDIDWVNDTINAVLIDTGTYTFSQAHDFYNDVSAGAVGTPVALANPTATSGVADADDVTFSAVSGATVEAIILYKDTGNAATSNLIAYIDSATGLAVTPNGGDITVQWDSGANKIFKL